MSTTQKASTLFFGASAAYFLFLTTRQAIREMSPRSISSDGSATLSLINFDAATADQLALILPSWTGVIEKATPVDCVIYPDDSVTTEYDKARTEARQGYHAIVAAALKQQQQQTFASQTKVIRPTTLSLKYRVEIAGSVDFDATLTPIEIAKACSGMPMEIAVILALCTGPEDSDVDLYKSSCSGKVCTNVEFLEELASKRRRAAILKKRNEMQMQQQEENENENNYNTAAAASSSASASANSIFSSLNSNNNNDNTNVAGSLNSNNSSSTSAASLTQISTQVSSNFLDLVDLFEPTDSTCLFEERQYQWQKLFAGQEEEELSHHEKKSEKKEEENNENEKEKNVPGFLKRWRNAKLFEASSENSQTTKSMMTSLLLEPWKYRAFIYVANSLMYSQLERKYGDLFGGFSKGFSHAIHNIKNMHWLRISPTGFIGDSWEQLKNSVNNVLFSSSSSSNNNNEKQQQKIPAFDTFCVQDFDYDAQDPLCGRFEVHITLKLPSSSSTKSEENNNSSSSSSSSEKVLKFCNQIGIKTVQIELPKGEFPSQLMTSFYMQGRIERCTSGAFDIAAHLQLYLGVEILRVKLELQVMDIRSSLKLKEQGLLLSMDGENNKSNLKNDSVLRPFYLLDGPNLGICPVRDHESKDRKHMTPTQYFEFHVKLSIPDSIKEKILKQIRALCDKHDAHLSRNAFKDIQETNKNKSNKSNKQQQQQQSEQEEAKKEEEKEEEKHWYFFVTLRLKQLGLISSLQQLDALTTALNSEVLSLKEFSGAKIEHVQKEFAAFDSDALLDRGWIDSRAVSWA